MTIQDDEAPAPPRSAPIAHQLWLTQDEILTAVGLAACKKSCLDGTVTANIYFHYTKELGVTGADVRLTPIGSNPVVTAMHRQVAGDETNAERIIRETPQAIKDSVARALAEVAAGPGGELITPGER